MEISSVLLCNTLEFQDRKVGESLPPERAPDGYIIVSHQEQYILVLCDVTRSTHDKSYELIKRRLGEGVHLVAGGKLHRDRKITFGASSFTHRYGYDRPGSHVHSAQLLHAVRTAIGWQQPSVA